MDLKQTAIELRAQGKALLRAADALDGVAPKSHHKHQPSYGVHKHRKPKREPCGEKLPNGRLCNKMISGMGRNGHMRWHKRITKEARKKAA